MPQSLYYEASSAMAAAASLARRAVELDGDDRWAHQALDLLALASGEIDAAAQYFRAALALTSTPTEPSAGR